MPGFRLFVTKMKRKCVGRKGLLVEDYVLCLKCKPRLLLSYKSVLEAQFLHQLRNHRSTLYLFQRRIRWNHCYHSTVQHMTLGSLIKFLFIVVILESMCIIFCYLSRFLVWYLSCNWTSVSNGASLCYSGKDTPTWRCCSVSDPPPMLNREEKCLKTWYVGFVILSSHAFCKSNYHV